MTGEAVGFYRSSFFHTVTRGGGVIYGRAPSAPDCAVPSKLGIPAALARPPIPGQHRRSPARGVCPQQSAFLCRGSCALWVPRLS